jgi:hypothetical protein
MLNDDNPPASAPRPSRKRTLFIAAVVGFNLLVVAALFAAWFINRQPSPGWNGTWKLDEAKSRVPATTLTVSITPEGMVHSESGSSTLSFRCDGNRYPSANGVTAICTQSKPSNMELTLFRNGSKELTAHWQLSPDQKALTVDGINFLPTAWTTSAERHYARTSGSTGFASAWKPVNPFELTPPTWQIRLQGHTFQASYPEKHWTRSFPLNGKDTLVHRAEVNPAATIALRIRNSRELFVTRKVTGKMTSVATWQLSPDGRTLTDTSWIPGGTSGAAVLVYDKQ